MRYVRARIDSDHETRVYREYITESMRLNGENKRITTRWIDVVTQREVDTRTGDEIAMDVIKSAGLVWSGKDECI